MKKLQHPMRFKNMIAGVMAGLLILSTTSACNKDQSDASKPATDSKQADTSDTITIGGLAPLTGPVSVYGNAANNGAQLAVKEINEAGGIDGKKINYIVYDEQGDSEQAISAYDRLVNEDKIVALIGDITTKPSIAVAQRAQQTKIPMLTPTGTGGDITKGNDNVYRVCFIDPDQGRTMASFVKDNLKKTKAAIIFNAADDYSVGLAETFKEKATELGIEVVAEESYPLDTKDFRTQLTRIAEAEPEVLYVTDYYGTNILILNQAREAGLDVPILGGDGWDGILSVTAEGKPEEADGVIFTNHFTAADSSEKVSSFVKAFEEAYEETPISFSALAYDAVYMMAQAIDEADSTDPAAIDEKLSAISFEGVTGSITFDENGDPIKPIKFIAIENGEYKLHSEVKIER